MYLASVVIPTCDRPVLLRRAVESARSAAEAASCPVEILVVDDGRVHSAQESLEGFSDVTTIKNPGPHGPSAARNLGVAHAQGELIFFLDDDDCLKPDYLAGVLQARASGACVADWGFSGGRRSHLRLLPSVPSLLTNVPVVLRLPALSQGVWISRDLFMAAGGLDPDIRVNEDTDFALTLAGMGYTPWFTPVSGIDRIAPENRPGGDRDSTTRLAVSAERAGAWQKICHKHAGLLADLPELRKLFVSRYAKFLARSGDTGTALKLALRERSVRVLLHALLGLASSAKS